MAGQPIDLSFQETMSGGFSLGASDPEGGRRQGEHTGMALAMHATVTIHDLDRFLSDPQHLGLLAGTIDFPAFGMAIPAATGVFNLFNPATDPGLKLMVYQLGFAHAGQAYYLAGQKEVRDDPGPDLWRDTTTLFTRLHTGSDTSGPVVGAGTLSLGVMALIRMLGTVVITNAANDLGRAAALDRFGEFFLGELWNSYRPHLNQ